MKTRFWLSLRLSGHLRRQNTPLYFAPLLLLQAPNHRLKKSLILYIAQCGKNLTKSLIHLKITQNVAFELWHFPPIFFLLKVTCLVTLFDCKLQVFKNSPKWTIFAIFNQLFSTQNVNVARFARNVE